MPRCLDWPLGFDNRSVSRNRRENHEGRQMKRCRQFLLGLAASMVTLSAASVWAQGARTIRIVVPFPPGGAADFLARVLAEEVGHGGPSVIVENRPGAGSVVGTDAVARAAPDGTTLLLDSKESLINPHLRKVGYDPLTSFESICRLVVSPTVISVNSRSPYRTFADLVGAAHAKPGQLTLAGSGPASPFQIGFEVLKRAAMMDMTFVPYQGAAPAVSALLGEHVTSALTTYSSVSEQYQAALLRGLAALSPGRSKVMPDVPAAGEYGYTGVDVEIWYGLVAPRGTPQATLSRLRGLFTAALGAPQVTERLGVQGLYPQPACGAEFDALIRNQYDEYGRIIRGANIRAE
jgi:tripartite-type tricarboxylate transporter receptor subunit TctC